MPKIQESQILARQIRVGDEVKFADRDYSEIVDDVDPKVKWTTVSTDYGTHKVLVDEMVTVYRIVPTEEEAAQQRHDYAVRHILSHAELSAQAVIDTKAKLIEDLDTASASWHGSMWENYAMAQAESVLWVKVLKVAEVQNVDVVEAAKLVRDDLIEKFVSHSPYRHSSTSMMSNTATALEHEVSRRFVNDLKWILP